MRLFRSSLDSFIPGFFTNYLSGQKNHIEGIGVKIHTNKGELWWLFSNSTLCITTDF